MHYPTLFVPGSIAKQAFRNRIILAPMTRISATENGMPTETLRKYYTSFAKGGFGALISEGLYIDQTWSQTYVNQPGIASDAQAEGWKQIVHDVQQNNTLFIAQLMHAGALSQKNIWRSETIAPSAVRPLGEQLGFYHGEGEYPLPTEMTEQQILDVIDSFADSAERAVSVAGFNGVEIHAANGYLLDQFLTDYSNQRNDRWGGDLTGRLTLTLEVIKAVKKRLGDKAILGVRISQGKVNDFQHKWKEGEAGAKQLFSLIAEAGVDYIHITEYKAWESAFSDNTLSLAEIARQAAPDTTLIINGGLDNGELAEQVLEKGADFVAIGKAALANHDWPERVKNNIELDELSNSVLAPTAEIKPFEMM